MVSFSLWTVPSTYDTISLSNTLDVLGTAIITSLFFPEDLSNTLDVLDSDSDPK